MNIYGRQHSAFLPLQKDLLTCPEGHGDECPEARDGVDDEPVDQEADRQAEQGQEPEPEEQEELLVYNVVRKNTHGLKISL